MKILITGSTGQLARELQSELAGTGKLLALGHNALDLAVPEQIREQVRLLRPDLIINAAAYTAVDPAETHREQAFAVNARGPQVLAEEAARLGVPLIHYSTDYVFDGRKTEPYDEHDTPNPLGVYGASKLAGEQAIQAVGGEHLILRTSWVYGVHGHNFVKTMLRLARQRDALGVVSDQIGCPTQAGSIASVLLELARRYADGAELAWGVYHYSGAPACSWYDFAVEIFRQGEAAGLIARQPEVSPIMTAQYPTPARRPAWSVLDCSRFEAAFGLAPHRWQEDLADVLAILRQQEANAVKRERTFRA